MASDPSYIFEFDSFGCFDDAESAPSLFDNLETLHLPTIPESSSTTTSLTLAEQLEPNSPGFQDELMSLGSPTTSEDTTSSPWMSNLVDHTYAYEHDTNNNSKIDFTNMPELASLQHGRSPSPGGSLTSQEESTDLLHYLINETGINISVKREEERTKQRSEPVFAVRNVSKGKKRQLSHEEEDDDDRADMTGKSRKNAVAARENRLKKKRYIEGLEKENKSLLSENAKLHKSQDKLESRVSSLTAEVDYLKSVLYNQSALSGLLKKIGPEAQVRLSSSFNSREQRLQKELLKPSNGGVCLHVNGKDASLEFCARCSLMSEGTGPQQ